jgi:hypothetical protein
MHVVWQRDVDGVDPGVGEHGGETADAAGEVAAIPAPEEGAGGGGELVDAGNLGVTGDDRLGDGGEILRL